ncbi:tail assembly chaperone [Microbacterium phage GardenState]|uniref:Tail assembly chaperone n=2 Tax=Gardenstatevirus TaxID=3425012 RepID=A0A4Y6E6Z9_9CAUD|nr:tail assembly chaperone [Microbacterium phage IAmGroot]QOI66925.1 tail assembly chaperone [Microbacterium phage GardenState]
MAARKTANPIAAEALSLNIAFVFEGREYSAPPTSEWSIDALEAFENGRILAMLRLILSDEDFSAFRSRHNKVAELNAFITAMQKAQGIAGN